MCMTVHQRVNLGKGTKIIVDKQFYLDLGEGDFKIG